MKLLLHIGTEKTGSSYLQSMAAINRDALQQSGIWFPLAGKREFELQRGHISAGNAQPLTNALKAGEYEKVKSFLQQHMVDAKEQQCNTVLLSNELLVLEFAQEEKMQQLQAIVQNLGFSSIHSLLILRDPIDQALSLYKHRAKSGTAPQIEDWPADHYHYGNGLYDFLSNIKKTSIQLSCRKYNRGYGFLEKAFFIDWLGINLEMQIPSRKVNPSLSISEILLIKLLRQKNRWLPLFLYDRLLAVPGSEKAKEPYITAYYRDVLASYITHYEATWLLCNQYLPEEEQIEVPEKRGGKFQMEQKVMTFSEKQAEVLVGFMQEINTSKFKWKLRTTQLRRQLGRLKSKVIK